MERDYMRETPEIETVNVIEKQKIGVVGISRGAGVTLIAASLAKALSDIGNRKVAFLEVCDRPRDKRALTYDAIGFEKRFKARVFLRFYSEIKRGGGIRRLENRDERINWGLLTPEDLKEGTDVAPIEIIRLINNISGDLIICDISECQNACDYLIDMDLVLFVIDPMPSRMIAGYPFLREVKRLEYNGKKVVWVINKYNSGINKRELAKFLKLKEYYRVPLIRADYLYGAEYNCKIPYEMRDIRGEMKEILEKIIVKELEIY